MTDLNIVDILLVEDSETDAEMTIRALKRHNLVNRLVWVTDGARALDFMYRRGEFADRPAGSPKLVLLDLKMPKVDGLEVLAQLKADAELRTVPVVVLTSSAEESDVLRSHELGVNSYLVKPVEFGSFMDVVAQTGLYWAVLNRLPKTAAAASS
jgi:CheY-like chemotaxis protein